MPNSRAYCFGECYRLSANSLMLLEKFFKPLNVIEDEYRSWGINFTTGDYFDVSLSVHRKDGLASIIVSSEIPALARDALNEYTSTFNLEPIQPENSAARRTETSFLLGTVLQKLQESYACDAPIN